MTWNRIEKERENENLVEPHACCWWPSLFLAS